MRFIQDTGHSKSLFFLLLILIPLYNYTLIYPFSCWWRPLTYFPLLATINKVARNILASTHVASGGTSIESSWAAEAVLTPTRWVQGKIAFTPTFHMRHWSETDHRANHGRQNQRASSRESRRMSSWPWDRQKQNTKGIMRNINTLNEKLCSSKDTVKRVERQSHLQ